ncbi:MAG: type II secretion system F family protein [Alphaproteobacteria bacterium]|nr:type II secretion system F family protein [Alphaproteobacteria bacterium]MCW5744172.1 type II secretion system F family protein [Alphaproteobacteria bacterium]
MELPGNVAPEALFLAFSMVFGLCVAVWYVLTVEKQRRQQRERLEEVRERLWGQAARNVKQARQALRKTADSKMTDKMVMRWLPNPAALQDRLERTGVNISVGDYALICAGIGGIVAVVLILLVGLSMPIGLLAAAAAALGLPHIWVGRRVNKRIDQFNAIFPDALDLMVRALRSGIPIQEAIANASNEIGEPVGGIFRRVQHEMRIGVPLEDAFWRVAESIKVPEFNFLIIAMSIQRETGGNLAETLGNLSNLLRERRQMKLKIKAFSSEARATAIIMGSLPFVLGLVLFLLNPDYMSTMFSDPRGMTMLAVAGGSMSIGIFIIKRMASFEI